MRKSHIVLPPPTPQDPSPLAADDDKEEEDAALFLLALLSASLAAEDEADEAATVREGTPWGEMLPFVHPTPGTVAVAAAVATVSFVVMIALPPATRWAATAEPVPSDEAPDAAR